jgi:hypothetical protein
MSSRYRSTATVLWLIALANAQTIGDITARLNNTLGAPLVYKTDNGAEFVGAGAWEVQRDFGVEHLCSHRTFRATTGACEAGHGATRFHAELLAHSDGQPGQWTLNHLEGARNWTNDLIQASTGQSPSWSFDRRQPITRSQRQAFQAAVASERQRRVDELAAAATYQRRTIISTADRISRQAICAALEGFEYLTTRRVPIRQPIPYEKRESISQ